MWRARRRRVRAKTPPRINRPFQDDSGTNLVFVFYFALVGSSQFDCGLYSNIHRKSPGFFFFWFLHISIDELVRFYGLVKIVDDPFNAEFTGKHLFSRSITFHGLRNN